MTRLFIYSTMAQKGVLTTADYLPISEYERLIKCLRKDKLYLWELYCRISFYSSLRISDVLNLKWKDVLKKESTTVTEIKTGKTRRIVFNEVVRNNIYDLYELLEKPDLNDYLIQNWKTKRPYTTKHVNETLKVFKFKYKLQIKAFSSHTFRKTFGRWFYESKGCTDHALTLLSETFNHTGTSVTRRYLGFTSDEISSVFMSIDF